MKRHFGITLATVGFCFVLLGSVRADAQDANAIIDKAIKALGGEAQLGKATAYTCKAKSKFTRGGNESVFNSEVIIDGLGKSRSEFEGIINGNGFKGLTVVNGDKAWRKFGGSGVQTLDAAMVASEKRNVYLQVIPMTLVPLKSKDFKSEAAGEEKIGDKSADVLKITGPDGKDFKLYFDKESGRPVRMTARVLGFGGEELTQDVIYSNYKEMGGIMKATNVDIKRDGELFIQQEVTEFKVAANLPPETFAEPQ